MDKFTEDNQDHLGSVEEDDFPSNKISILSQGFKKRSILPIGIWIYLSYALSSFHWKENYNSSLWVNRSVIMEGEYWRLVTSIMVHANFGHFLSNFFLLFVFGVLLHNYYGKLAFPFVSLVIGIITNFLTIYFYPIETKIVGASGMIYGMVVRYGPYDGANKTEIWRIWDRWLFPKTSKTV